MGESQEFSNSNDLKTLLIILQKNHLIRAQKQHSSLKLKKKIKKCVEKDKKIAVYVLA